MTKERRAALHALLEPRLIACVAGAWSKTDRYALAPDVAAQVIQTSGSRAIVLHIERPNDADETLSLDHLLEQLGSKDDYIFLFNTSGCHSTHEALERIDLIEGVWREVSASEAHRFVKLEVLNDAHNPDDAELAGVLEQLSLVRLERTLPLVFGIDALCLAQRLGCPACRILNESIGSARGVGDDPRLRDCLQRSTVPLILEGGITCPRDVATALEMGFSAVLVNSAFRRASDPIALADALRVAAQGF